MNDHALPDRASPERETPRHGPPERSPPDRGSPNRTSTVRRSTGRILTITLLVSLGLHLSALVAAILLLPSELPVADGPEQTPEVELVMVEHKGDLQPPVTSSQPPAEARPEAKSTKAQQPPARAQVEPKPETLEAAAKPAMAPDPAPDLDTPVHDDGPPAKPTPAAAPAKTSEPTSKPEPPVQEAAAETQPVPPGAQQALTVTLSGTDSPSEARAWGNRVIPAKADAVFHNRPPEYPPEAVMNGEQGTVVLIIHVSPAGSTASIDVARSSGYVLLDRAAQEAVMRWRFLPAVKDGQAVASDMRMEFVFDFR
jgi:protein TonB